jgi:hypothetical protein
MNYKQKLYLGRWEVHSPVDFLAGNKPAQKNWKRYKKWGLKNGAAYDAHTRKSLYR